MLLLTPSGSLRAASADTALLAAAPLFAPASVRPRSDALPLFSRDRDPTDPAVATVRAAPAGADGVLAAVRDAA